MKEIILVLIAVIVVSCVNKENEETATYTGWNEEYHDVVFKVGDQLWEPIIDSFSNKQKYHAWVKILDIEDGWIKYQFYTPFIRNSMVYNWYNSNDIIPPTYTVRGNDVYFYDWIKLDSIR